MWNKFWLECSATLVVKLPQRLGVSDDARQLYEFLEAMAGLPTARERLSTAAIVAAAVGRLAALMQQLEQRIAAMEAELCRCIAVADARLHRAGELAPVWVPDAAHEAMRDLVRARATARRVLGKARQHLQGFLLRHGQIYRGIRGWTRAYRRWPGERGGIAAVGLHPVPGPARDQRRRDHAAVLPEAAEQPMHAVAARSGFVTEAELSMAALQPLHEPMQRLRNMV